MNAPATVVVPLHQVAHARAGDKGNRLNIAVFGYDARIYPLLTEQISEAVVARQFEHRRPTSVKRYTLPNLCALNFVLDGVLEGGVNSSLVLDRHGKSLSYLLLELTVVVPLELADTLAFHQRRQV
jgi:hypothetical protein